MFQLAATKFKASTTYLNLVSSLTSMDLDQLEQSSKIFLNLPEFKPAVPSYSDSPSFYYKASELVHRFSHCVNWAIFLTKIVPFNQHALSRLGEAVTPKSSSKVEQMGALNFCLHAVGSFIHLHHVWAGLQNFIHLHHPVASAGYVHASKI